MLLSVKGNRPLGSIGWENKVSSIVSYFIALWCAPSLQSLHNYVYVFLLNYQPYKIKICSSLCWGLFHLKLPFMNTLGSKEYSAIHFYFDFFHLHCFSRSWSPSYCVQPACILSLRREASFSTYFSIWSRDQMMSSCGIWLLLWEINIMLTCSFFKFGIMITFLIFMPSFVSKVSFNKGNTDLVHSALQCFPSCHSTYLCWTSALLC